ncbi:hypothetical protein IGI04_010472 [Brassica rapa subsp. trilocularis]|uniref:Transmembrane protein n=1 Tax=Brassica rapa subsp. trilocularis TaxID=1813537 RepID=A0ABQ7N1A6_BRACM|nr:hypothetical protein IGI04_010472 [Brassica rapa subsp. trilocularis]
MKLSGFRTKSTFISYIRMVARWSFGAVTRSGPETWKRYFARCHVEVDLSFSGQVRLQMLFRRRMWRGEGWPSMTLFFFNSRLFFVLLIFAAFGVVVPHQLLVVFVPLRFFQLLDGPLPLCKVAFSVFRALECQFSKRDLFGRAEPRRGRIVSHFVALLHIYSEVKTFIDLGVTIQSI